MTDIYLFDIVKNEIIKINTTNEDKSNILDKLYFLQWRLPTNEELNGNINQNDVRKELSKIEDKIPLYDVYTENIYLIKKFNVYIRVMHQNYRFLKKIYWMILKKEKNY